MAKHKYSKPLSIDEFLKILRDPNVDAIEYHFRLNGLRCSHRALTYDGKIFDTGIDDEEWAAKQTEFIDDYKDRLFFIDEVIYAEDYESEDGEESDSGKRSKIVSLEIQKYGKYIFLPLTEEPAFPEMETFVLNGKLEPVAMLAIDTIYVASNTMDTKEAVEVVLAITDKPISIEHDYSQEAIKKKLCDCLLYTLLMNEIE